MIFTLLVFGLIISANFSVSADIPKSNEAKLDNSLKNVNVSTANGNRNIFQLFKHLKGFFGGETSGVLAEKELTPEKITKNAILHVASLFKHHIMPKVQGNDQKSNITKPGTCPSSLNGFMKQFCSTDSDCPDVLKCCPCFWHGGLTMCYAPEEYHALILAEHPELATMTPPPLSTTPATPPPSTTEEQVAADPPPQQDIFSFFTT